MFELLTGLLGLALTAFVIIVFVIPVALAVSGILGCIVRNMQEKD